MAAIAYLRRDDQSSRRPWHGSAFIVESLVLLVFLVASLAVLIQVLGGAHERGVEADRLSNAIVLASNDAEAFAADPSADDFAATFVLVDGELVEAEGIADAEGGDRYNVSRTVRANDEKAGALYEAHIEVTCDDDIVYQVDTARYVSSKEVQK